MDQQDEDNEKLLIESKAQKELFPSLTIAHEAIVDLLYSLCEVYRQAKIIIEDSARENAVRFLKENLLSIGRVYSSFGMRVYEELVREEFIGPPICSIPRSTHTKPKRIPIWLEMSYCSSHEQILDYAHHLFPTMPDVGGGAIKNEFIIRVVDRLFEEDDLTIIIEWCKEIALFYGPALCDAYKLHHSLIIESWRAIANRRISGLVYPLDGKKDVITWIGPHSPAHWARVFQLTWETIKKHIESGKIRAEKVSSKLWKIHRGDVPTPTFGLVRKSE